MISEKIMINNVSGLHARPAGVFAKEAAKYKSDIKIKKNEALYNAKSILGVLSACIKCGTEIEIMCSGGDEQDALHALVSAVEIGLGE